MKAWISTDDDGRIVCSVYNQKFATEDMAEVEFPDDFDFSRQGDFLYKDGELTEDGAWTAKIQEEQAKAAKAEQAEAQLKVAARMFIQANSANLTDAQALEVSRLHKVWTIGETYTQGEIVQYNDELYRCGQPTIVASETYKPGDEGTTALYSHITMEGDVEVWKEWDGVSGNYKQGQHVKDSEDGKIYESLIPNNTYGPPHEQPSYWRVVE